MASHTYSALSFISSSPSPLGYWLLIVTIYSGEVALPEGFYVEVENEVVTRVECGRHSFSESYLGAVVSFVCLFWF